MDWLGSAILGTTTIGGTLLQSEDCSIFDKACIDRKQQELDLKQQALLLEQQKVKQEGFLAGQINPTTKYIIGTVVVLVVVVIGFLLIRKLF